MSKSKVNREVIMLSKEIYEGLYKDIDDMASIIVSLNRSELSNEDYDKYKEYKEKFEKFNIQLEDMREYFGDLISNN
jgi:hypothetical protein